jgi:anthranilate phosphoribosyltransferase
MTSHDPSADPLSHFRLLAALDALLVEGSVGGAAGRLQVSAPAMSRLLAQVRTYYGDAIMIRRGGRLIPTPFAEELRPRLRALIVEARALLSPSGEGPPAGGDAPVPLAGFPLTLPLTRADAGQSVEGAPHPESTAQKLLSTAGVKDPAARFARHIAVVAGGLGRSRPLDDEEAEDLLSIMLEGSAHPIQLGAMLMALHHRGITAKELASFATTARRHAGISDRQSADLDWPVYGSPRNRTPPWYLHAARLVAASGVRVVLHGTGDDPKSIVAEALDLLPVAQADSMEAAASAVQKHGIVFVGLGSILPQLLALLRLYGLFELRTITHHIVSLLNPLSAPAIVMGVQSAAHRELPRDAAALLGVRDFVATGAHRDVCQATPFRTSTLFGLVDGEPCDTHMPSTSNVRLERYPHHTTLEVWRAVWAGTLRDTAAEQVVIDTAAIALLAARRCGDFATAQARARELWAMRELSLRP